MSIKKEHSFTYLLNVAVVDLKEDSKINYEMIINALNNLREQLEITDKKYNSIKKQKSFILQSSLSQLLYSNTNELYKHKVEFLCSINFDKEEVSKYIQYIYNKFSKIIYNKNMNEQFIAETVYDADKAKDIEEVANLFARTAEILKSTLKIEEIEDNSVERMNVFWEEICK